MDQPTNQQPGRCPWPTVTPSADELEQWRQEFEREAQSSMYVERRDKARWVLQQIDAHAPATPHVISRQDALEDLAENVLHWLDETLDVTVPGGQAFDDVVHAADVYRKAKGGNL